MSESNGTELKKRAVFRMVNEQIRSLSDNFAFEGRNSFVCECCTASCTRAVHASLAEYASVRADERRFLVAPGHQNPRLETVVEENEEFAIVEILRVASNLAEEIRARDPQVV